MTKEERIERLEQEHNELKHRLDKLTLFLDEQHKAKIIRLLISELGPRRTKGMGTIK